MMKALLRPSLTPSVDVLVNAFGVVGALKVQDESHAETWTEALIRKLELQGGTSEIEQDLQDGNGFLRRWTVRTGQDEWVASGVSTAIRGLDGIGLTLKLQVPWGRLSVDDAREFFDGLWNEGGPGALAFYGFDQDDFSLQNQTLAIGLQHFGLSRSDVEFVRDRFGGEQIDPRGNPGFIENRDGTPLSVQWLNRWSPEVHTVLSLKLLSGFALLDERADGSIRLELKNGPGRLDDVGFHTNQLECRRRLGL